MNRRDFMKLAAAAPLAAKIPVPALVQSTEDVIDVAVSSSAFSEPVVVQLRRGEPYFDLGCVRYIIGVAVGSGRLVYLNKDGTVSG